MNNLRHGFSGMIRPDMVIPALAADSREAVLREMAGLLVRRRFCAETFVEAILERERLHPSGLPMPGGNIAIPHTDSDHVHRSVFLIARLTEPVPFFTMGKPEELLDVRMVSMFALTEKRRAGDALVALITAFQQPDLPAAMNDAPDAMTMYNVLVRAFEREGG